MLIIALVLALIGLVALVFAVVTSNEFVAWFCIGASVLGVVLLIIDALQERQRRDSGGEAHDAEADEDEAHHEEAAVDYPEDAPEGEAYPDEASPHEREPDAGATAGSTPGNTAGEDATHESAVAADGRGDEPTG